MRRWIGWALAAFGLGAGGAAGVRASLEPSCEAVREAANRLLTSARPEGAEPLLRRLLARLPDDAESHFHLGVLLRPRTPAAALLEFRQVHPGSPWGPSARLAEGDLFFDAGLLSAAESAWTSLRDDGGEDKALRGRFLALYGVQLRRTEWLGLLWRMADDRQAGFRESIQLVIASDVVWVGEGIVPLLERAVRADANDRASKRSLALLYHTTAQTRKLPTLIAAVKSGAVEDDDRATVLDVAVRQADRIAAAKELSAIPTAQRTRLESRADFQRTLGRFALLESRPQDAVRWLERSTRTEPFVATAHHALATAHRLLGNTEAAGLHAAVAQTLARIEQRTHGMQNAGKWTADEVVLLTRDLVAVGMVEEARAWLQFALGEQPEHAGLQAAFEAALRRPATSSRRPPAKPLDPRRPAP
jgi:tetratricopeptide (TPR) repeat protein